MTNSVRSVTQATDWAATYSALAYVYGAPQVTGLIKASPADFQVDEVMPHTPSNEGEHIWLKVQKERQNTEQVAKALARFAGVSPRDVGYSGLKDFQAVTTQWFSVWLPKSDGPEWANFNLPGVELLQVDRHSRKLKRGAHQANRFTITVRDIVGDLDDINMRLSMINKSGVANYFGAQRFGRGFNNLRLAHTLLIERKSIKNRNLRSIVLSAARSFLFNHVLSQRIQADTWNQLHVGEPANLDATNSTFSATDIVQEAERLTQLDIHPTGPLTGRGGDIAMSSCASLLALESQWLAPYRAFEEGLCHAGLEYQRRALRSKVHDLSWRLNDNSLRLEFSLQRGQFATAVLRELFADTN